MNISMIAAMGANRVIGTDNDLPWRLPDDFKYFRDVTLGHAVIMGRKNWESLPEAFRPLPNRFNIVMTRQSAYQTKGACVVSSLRDAINLVSRRNEGEIFIIGGGQIYQLAIDIADKIYLTEINGIFEGDIKFPVVDTMKWEEISRKHHLADKRHTHSFDFVVYKKKKA